MIDVKEANVLYLQGEYERACEKYLEGALEGDAECALNYAVCLSLGEGVPRDFASARSYFTFASEKYGEACYNLAVMYLEGIGTEKNYRLSLEYMEMAAERGVLEAELYLGVARTMGTLFIPDVRFLTLIPYPRAILREALPLIDGEVSESEFDKDGRSPVIRQDLTDAYLYFRSASSRPSDYKEEMSSRAKYLYARCYLDGVGVDFNRDTANKLMLKAAEEGSAEALYYLETDAPYVLAALDKERLSDIRKNFERLG